MWVSHGWYQDQWWELLPSRGNCSDGDIEAILEGAVAVSHLPSDQLPSANTGRVRLLEFAFLFVKRGSGCFSIAGPSFLNVSLSGWFGNPTEG